MPLRSGQRPDAESAERAASRHWARSRGNAGVRGNRFPPGGATGITALKLVPSDVIQEFLKGLFEATAP